MNSVYELEKLVSTCSTANSKRSSIHEAGITFVTPKTRPDDQTVVTVGTKNGNQNAYQEEKPNYLESI